MASIVILGLSLTLFSVSLLSDLQPAEGKRNTEELLSSDLGVLLLHTTQTDLDLGNALAYSANVSVQAYDISSDSTIRNLLPLSVDNFQAIWWFASSFPSISPIDLFNGSYTNMTSWFASRKGFFVVTEHVSNLDMAIRDFLGLRGTYPYSYPLNGSEATLELEVVANETLPDIPKGTKVTFSSRAGFFVPERSEDLVAQVRIEQDFSDMTSGLLIPHDLRYFSILLSVSPSQSWYGSRSVNILNRFPITLKTGPLQTSNIFDFLQIVASLSTSGGIPTYPNGGQVIGDFSEEMLGPILIGLLGLLGISLLFVGIKTGKIQNLIFGAFSGTVLFVAHIAYSPSKRRLDREDLMTNKLRANIVDALREKGPGGAHLRELQRELNCGISSLLWHLQTLDDFGVVAHAKLGGYHVFYLTELSGIMSPELAMTIRSETARKICQTMTKRPKKPLKLSVLAKSAGCHVETARYHLKKLEEAEVVTRIREKTHTRYVLRQDIISEVRELVSN